ncbi:beta-N-acetylhexosaminidase, partial [Micromonospora sp. NPDC003776]
MPTQQPAAADLARTAARHAAEQLAPPTPVRLGDVVPAPERVVPEPTADYLLPADAAIRVSPAPGA